MNWSAVSFDWDQTRAFLATVEEEEGIKGVGDKTQSFSFVTDPFNSFNSEEFEHLTARNPGRPRSIRQDATTCNFAAPHPDALDPQKCREIVRVIEAILAQTFREFGIKGYDPFIA